MERIPKCFIYELQSLWQIVPTRSIEEMPWKRVAVDASIIFRRRIRDIPEISNEDCSNDFND